MTQRGSVYVQHDQEIRQMCAGGASLSEMSRKFHAHCEDLKYYIDTHNIPHAPFEKRRPLEKNGRWKGGEMLEDGKYILVKKPDHPCANRHGYVRKHRLVMEQKLGRYLTRDEVVHHIDGNPKNNSIENLELFSKNSDHLRKELTGRVPKWTPDGLLRMMGGIHLSANRRRKSNRSK